MIVYKGTDKNMKCRGMQYEIGKTVISDDAIRCGNKGFHSCERPLDVFQYYHPKDGCRYFICEADGKIDKDDQDSKIASSELTIKEEIGLRGIVKAQIEYVKSNTTSEHTDPTMATAGASGAATAGKYGAATAGEYGAATAGIFGAATAGEYGAATAGDGGAATAGNRGAATAGDCGAATAGENGAATAGDSGAATAGYSGAATAGDSGAATAGENGAATAGIFGAATAGDGGAATAGDSGVATAGNRGAATAGEYGIAVCNAGKVRGGLHAILVISERDEDGRVISARVAHVDGKKIKPNVFYKLRNGEFVEAEDE